MKPNLGTLTLQHYTSLINNGVLFDHYPEATGDANQDLQAVCVSCKESGTATTTGAIQLVGGGVHIIKRQNYTRFYDILDSEAIYGN